MSESTQTTDLKHIKVAVGLVIDSSGKILIGQRLSPLQFKGKWEFPGGKIEPFESTADALKRELKEETGLDVRNSIPYMLFTYEYPQQTVELRFRKVYDFDGTASSLTHQKIRWVEVDELHFYDMLDANVNVIVSLQQECQKAIGA